MCVLAKGCWKGILRIPVVAQSCVNMWGEGGTSLKLHISRWELAKYALNKVPHQYVFVDAIQTNIFFNALSTNVHEYLYGSRWAFRRQNRMICDTTAGKTSKERRQSYSRNICQLEPKGQLGKRMRHTRIVQRVDVQWTTVYFELLSTTAVEHKGASRVQLQHVQIIADLKFTTDHPATEMRFYWANRFIN